MDVPIDGAHPQRTAPWMYQLMEPLHKELLWMYQLMEPLHKELLWIYQLMEPIHKECSMDVPIDGAPPQRTPWPTAGSPAVP
jgi:hypothetical protein